MKITILLVICSSLTLAQECPEYPPTECSPGDMHCYGSYGPDGCLMPDTCEPKRYGNDGYPCAGNCPVTCAPDETHCPGTYDYNGCQMADTCEPPRYDNDGNECSVNCPISCENS